MPAGRTHLRGALEMIDQTTPNTKMGWQRVKWKQSKQRRKCRVFYHSQVQFSPSCSATGEAHAKRTLDVKDYRTGAVGSSQRSRLNRANKQTVLCTFVAFAFLHVSIYFFNGEDLCIREETYGWEHQIPWKRPWNMSTLADGRHPQDPADKNLIFLKPERKKNTNSSIMM